MAIPQYETLMLPFLKAIEGKILDRKSVISKLSDDFKLTDEERKERYQKSNQNIFSDRVSWAATYLKKAGLIESPQRACYEITQTGMDVLKQKPSEVNDDFLFKFPQFRNFKKQPKKLDESQKEVCPKTETVGRTSSTPEERLEYAYKEMIDSLAQEIIETIKRCPPEFFEHLVIDLLLKMGYGGSRKDAGQSIGRTGDGGIDGIIKEDKLGLDVIYIQAKRWESQVPVSASRDFLGALTIKKAKKGVLITTSTFPKTSHSDVAGLENKVVLIDGNMLAELMIEHNVGVSIQSVYEVKKIDNDYFSED
ncbi:restriction endonuclease [Candidatus Magnetominusculus xianensis]|uniref:Restriction endonuclease n=1 Tax=Candidatus Magnetominusculus xianensis TaxID=1748249 RepID=A0ABR5SED6_9BACT|nr:restriction endonuclease [Candidatus Magnetominusculus xianensis]KWT84133.1 restriction endonuclease [Candidatus Magnetominusculus xianensis]MBF0402426.1 restriction endonuclease [Nitrospirota bacterium]